MRKNVVERHWSVFKGKKTKNVSYKYFFAARQSTVIVQ